MLMLSLEIGDRLVLSDEQTGAVLASIEVDSIRWRKDRPRKARLAIDAPKHIRINRDLLDQRIQRKRGVTVRQISADPNGPALLGAGGAS